MIQALNSTPEVSRGLEVTVLGVFVPPRIPQCMAWETFTDCAGLKSEAWIAHCCPHGQGALVRAPACPPWGRCRDPGHGPLSRLGIWRRVLRRGGHWSSEKPGASRAVSPMTLRAARAAPDFRLLISDVEKQILRQQERGQVSGMKEGMQVPAGDTAPLPPGQAVRAAGP